MPRLFFIMGREERVVAVLFSDFWESQFKCLWHLAVVSPPRPDPS